MKKQYKNPTIVIVNLRAKNSILADSLEYNRTTTVTSGNLSRRGGNSVWDDDEDDDY